MGDVGDLTKLLVTHGGMRTVPDAERKLAHELAECMWSILVLSQKVGIDLESAFLHTMDDLEQHIAAQRHP